MQLFSADSHVNEPPEAWERVPKDFRERGPRIVRNPPGLKGLYLVACHPPACVRARQPFTDGGTLLMSRRLSSQRTKNIWARALLRSQPCAIKIPSMLS